MTTIKVGVIGSQLILAITLNDINHSKNPGGKTSGIFLSKLYT
jgi:hypothetical protein